MKIARKSATSPMLRVDDNFAVLLDTRDDGSFIYEFRYFCSTVEAIRREANYVLISVKREIPVPAPDVFDAIRNSNDNSTFIDDIRLVEARGRDARRNASSSTIITARSDITANVNNSVVPEIAAGVSSTTAILGTQRVIELRSVAELKQSNIDFPTLLSEKNGAQSPSSGQATNASHTLLSLGIDPATVATAQPSPAGAHNSFAGLGSTGRSQTASNSPNTPVRIGLDIIEASLLSNPSDTSSAHNDFSDSTLVPIIVDVQMTELLNVQTLVIPPVVGFDDFYVEMSLMTVFGSVIETITKRVPHSNLIRILNTPVVAPRVAMSPFQFHGKNVIEIEQLDGRATRMRIFRRRIAGPDGTLSLTRYELVAEIPLKRKDGQTKFIDIVNNSSTLIYRCIPVGPTGILCSEFSGVVSLPVKFQGSTRSNRSNAASIDIRVVDGGLAVSVSSIPSDVVSVSILRRDLTEFEHDGVMINGQESIKLVGPSLSNLLFNDTGLKDGHVYEYTCMLYYRDGLSMLSTAYAIKQYFSLVVGAAELSVTNLQIVRAGANLDVVFDISSAITDEGLGAVKSALARQDVKGIYDSDLANERDKLQKLIAHSVSRIDVTTGTEETFGTFTETTFSDAVLGRKTGVSQLQDGHKYRYVISTLLRDTETMFDDLKKDATDPTTGKAYSFKPSKFRHPLAISRGTLVSRESLISNHPQDDFSFGNIGNSQEIDVSLTSFAPKIIDAHATRLNRKNMSVRWNVEGDVAQIEHFIIIKELLGRSTIIGKTHSISTGKSFEFIDDISPDDIGELTYRVIPIMNDYSRGAELRTNSVVVTDGRAGTR
jgi:hypothetical protein